MNEWVLKEFSRKLDKLIDELEKIRKEVNSLTTRINVLEVQVEERTQKRVILIREDK